MEDTTPEPNRLSRRSLVKGAAVVAAAGTATLAVGGAASASVTVSDTNALAAVPGARAESAGATAKGPVIVHVRDASTGELDIYSGDSHVAVQDRDLAARLAKLAR